MTPMLNASQVHALRAVLDSVLTGNTVKVGADSVRVVGHIQTGSPWATLIPAGLGALGGAVVGALSNFLFNGKLERRRERTTRREIRLRLTFDAYLEIEPHVAAMVEHLGHDAALPFFLEFRPVGLEGWQDVIKGMEASQEGLRVSMRKLDTAFMRYNPLVGDLEKAQSALHWFIWERLIESQTQLRISLRENQTALSEGAFPEPVVTAIKDVAEVADHCMLVAQNLGTLLQRHTLQDLFESPLPQPERPENRPDVPLLTINGIQLADGSMWRSRTERATTAKP